VLIEEWQYDESSKTKKEKYKHNFIGGKLQDKNDVMKDILRELEEELQDKFKLLNIDDIDNTFFNLTVEKEAYSYKGMRNIYKF